MDILENFAEHVLRSGGSIHPLMVPANLTGGTGLMNPSVCYHDGKFRVILRHVNYTFYHSESRLFQHPWGPLTYIHPENDVKLRTVNYYCELGDDLEVARYDRVDTTKFDTYEPLWEFVGLEDARIFAWNDRLYMSGVRRDTTTNGQGRMELSEIVVNSDSVTEVSRYRIPVPGDETYCEKNWMPVLDMPNHYVKWTSPTEVVQINSDSNKTTTVYTGAAKQFPRDIRGGTQVIPWGEFRIALTHEVDLFKSEGGRKDAVYRHRFVLWDKNWNIVGATRDFSVMNAGIEFAVGICDYNEHDVLISFGFQDNAAYVMRTPRSLIDSMIMPL